MGGIVIGLGILVATWLVAVLALLWTGRRHVARELAALIPNVLHLFRDVLRDERVPARSKALVLLGVAWLASPIDLIPEFLPVIGPLDDIVVAALVLRHVVKRAGPAVVRAHWRGDPRTAGLLLRLAGAAS